MKYAIEGSLITNIANKLREYISADRETITNLIRSSIDTNGSIYNNGTGWKYGYRLNSSGVEKVDDFATPQSITGYIKAIKGDVFLFTNIDTGHGYSPHVFCYDSSFNMTSEITPKYNNTTFVSATVTDSSCAYIRVSASFDVNGYIEKQGGGSESESNTYKLIEMPEAINAVYEKGLEDGLASGSIELQSKTVTPSASGSKVTADSGYDGLSEVTVNGDADLVAGNIKKGVNIFNVTGTYEGEGGITPSGSLNITENGTFDVTDFAQAIVNVASSGGSNVATGEVTATAVTKLTIDTGKTDATHFLLYIDDASLSSSTVIMFLIMPLTSFGFRYSGSEGKVTMFSKLGTTYTTTGSISNGVATCDMGNTFAFTARKYKWIAW